MKTELRVPACLLVAFQALMFHAQAQQVGSQLFNCRSGNNAGSAQAPVQLLDTPAVPTVSNPRADGPLFGDYSFSTPLAKSLRRTLLNLYPDGLRVQYTGGAVIRTEDMGAFGGVSLKLRYTDGYPGFDTNPLKNSPQDCERRRRVARRVLLFGGNTFFYSECEGTGLFLGQKKRACLLFGAARNSFQAKLAFGF